MSLLGLTVLGLTACGGQAAAPARHAHRAVRSSTRPGASTPAAAIDLSYRTLFTLPAPVQDPAGAPVGSDGFVLLGGLTPADTSSADVITADLHGTLSHASLPNAQHDAQATALGGKVYLFGGGQYTEYDHILAYDPSANTVTNAGALPSAASDVAVTGDGSTAYVVGGFDGSSWLSTILAFTPGAAPRVVGHLPLGLRYAAAAAADGYVVVAGGTTPTGVSDAIYRFDPRTGAVTTLAHLPGPLAHAGAGVIGGTLFVVGGWGQSVSDRSATVWAIDLQTGRVRSAGRLPAPLSDMAVVSLPGRLIVAGGATASGTQDGVGELVPSG